MPTTVELPDGVSVEFPDGMDELSMHQEITKAFPQLGGQTPSERTSIPAPGEMMPTVTAQTLPGPVQAFPVQQQQMEQGKTEAPPTAEEAEQMLMTPQVSIPRFGKEGTSTRGVSELVSMPFETMTAPAGPLIATAQMIPGLGELVDASFAASLAKQGAQRLGQASVTGNRQDYVQGVGELVLGALAGRGAAHVS